MAIVETQTYKIADDYSRMALDIRIVDKTLNFNNKIVFVVDTGSSCVVLPAKDMYLDQKQSKIVKENSVITHHLGIDGKPVEYYRYIVSEFQLGGIVFKRFPIHITFKENADMRLLGMSFLKMFELNIRPQEHLITLKTLSVTEKIITKGYPTEGIEKVLIPKIGVADVLNQLDAAHRDEETRKAHKMALENEK